MRILAFTGHYYPFMEPPERCISPFLENLSETNDVEIICPVYNRKYKTNFVKGKIKLNFVDSFPNKVRSYIQTNRDEKKHLFLNNLLFFAYRAVRFVSSYIKIDAYKDASMVTPLLKRAEEIYATNKFNVVISVSLPFYTHVAALKFKSRHPDVRWVTFTTDPFAYNEVNPIVLYKKKSAINLEQSIYNCCDYCLTTEELYSNLTNEYNILPSKILKLPYLLTAQPSQGKSKSAVDNSPINILYAGYVYYKIRNPYLMMETFKLIPNINLNLYVAGDRFCRKYLKGKFPDNYFINGLVHRERYLGLLSENDVLVNLSNTIRLQAPSKLLELVSTGKPVINFYHHRDVGYQIIEKYPLGINISYNQKPQSIARELSLFINKNAGKCLSYETICSLFEDHLFINQISKVRDILLDINRE